jgi:hypothetical protein
VLNAAGEVVGMVSRTVSVQPPPPAVAHPAGSASPGQAGQPAVAQSGTSAAPQPPAGNAPQGPKPAEKHRPPSVHVHEQMVFKDCVSVETMRALMAH